MLCKTFRTGLLLLVAAGGLLSWAVASAQKSHRQPRWSPGELVLTGGGCPIETPDALSLMFASGRPGGAGDIDIWVVDRDATNAPWHDPVNMPAPVNSTAADFCPSPFDRSLFFVSTRALDDEPVCGGGDIFLTRHSPAGEWSDPIHLPCAPIGPNTGGTERSPSLVRTWYGTFLFYSTNGGAGDDDIYVSTMGQDGTFGPGHVVHALSTPGFQDQMPTVRPRSNGSFEVVFNSDRDYPGPGVRVGPFGSQDVYYSKSGFLPFWWTPPLNAGPNVNTEASETRASLSADGNRLYVGRGDIFVSERK